MLKVRNLSVEIAGRKILDKINMRIDAGEVIILFGPNGSGKTTLIKTILGLGGYDVKGGEIILKGKKINGFAIDERVKLGLGMMYQYPPKIRGVKLGQIARFLSKDGGKIKNLAAKLSLESHLERDINLGFSGGEMKRSELFQILLQDPDMLFLDEPESGVDLENISIMGNAINDYLADKTKSALIITHTGYILDYVKAERGCIMIDGKFWCVGEPREMFESIKKSGYEHCKECQCPQKN